METWTGYTKAEMEGQTLERIMEPDDYRRHADNYVPWITSPETKAKTLILECRLLAKDGKRRTVRVTARRVPNGESAIALLDRPQNVLDLTNSKP
jgi:PAS domain S-box-containing protein